MTKKLNFSMFYLVQFVSWTWEHLNASWGHTWGFLQFWGVPPQLSWRPWGSLSCYSLFGLVYFCSWCLCIVFHAVSSLQYWLFYLVNWPVQVTFVTISPINELIWFDEITLCLKNGRMSLLRKRQLWVVFDVPKHLLLHAIVDKMLYVAQKQSLVTL